jgi:hypothetical protein
MNDNAIAPVVALHQVEMSIPVHVANREPLWQGIGGNMPAQSKLALPVSKENSQVVESARVYRDIEVAILVQIVRDDQFWQDQATRSMVGEGRGQKRGAE